MTQNEWEKIAETLRASYAEADSDCQVGLETALGIIDAFATLYRERNSRQEESYYLGNLISTGRIEGAVEDVLGTVPAAVERTKQYYRTQGVVYAQQAELLTRNLVNVLRKERFAQPIDALLQPWSQLLTSASLSRQ